LIRANAAIAQTSVLLALTAACADAVVNLTTLICNP